MHCQAVRDKTHKSRLAAARVAQQYYTPIKDQSF